MSPSVSAIQGRKLNEPSRQAKSPARAAEIKVMTRTAARVEISHLEITSNPSHSSFETSGITLRALRHIAKFIINSLLKRFWINYIHNGFNQFLTFVRKILEILPDLFFCQGQ